MAQRGRRLPVHSLDVMVYQVEVLKRPALQVALDNLVSVEVVKCACKRKRDTGSADYAPRGRMGPRPAYGDNDLLYLDSRVQEGHATDTTAEHMQALLCGTGLRASRRMLGAMYNDLRLTWKKVRARRPAAARPVALITIASRRLCAPRSTTWWRSRSIPSSSRTSCTTCGRST